MRSLLMALLLLGGLGGCTLFLDTQPVETDGTEDTREDVSELPDAQGEDPQVDVDQDPGVDADVEDVSDADEVDLPPSRNGCGGLGTLLQDGEVVEPGGVCGAFEEGVWVCAGLDLVRCVNTAPPHVCGGTGVLTGEPGAACGPCGDGVWVCDAAGRDVICAGAGSLNVCGGCASEEMVGRPGAACGADDAALWVCVTPDQLACLATAGNACGGAAPLTWADQVARPGDACELACGGGVLVCDGEDALRCVSDGSGGALNACGGCGPLPGREGGACGLCGGGTWSCVAGGRMVCTGAQAVDACGGCSDEDGRPGESCGSDRVLACEGTALTCVAPVDDAVANACGGTSELPQAPGATCGTCGTGALTCASPNRLTCSLVDDDDRNACGGCASLVGRPGDPCGTCGQGNLVCDGETSMRCDEPAETLRTNACGGCGPLAGEPETSCGTCALWRCASNGQLRCRVDTDDPACASQVRCADLTCDQAFRRCDEATGQVPARCGDCVAGREEWEGACTPTCAALACAAENRACVPASSGAPAQCGACLGGFEEQNNACVAAEDLLPPTQATATRGTHVDRVVVTWQAVAGASGYVVYRDGQRVTDAPVTSPWEDRTAPAGSVPAAVEGVQATTDRTGDVRVTWQTPAVPDGPSAVYQVRAVSGDDESALSGSAQGYRAGAPVSGWSIDAAGRVVTVSSSPWLDTEAPAGTLTAGTLQATDTQAAQVTLTVTGAGAQPGASLDYRVAARNAAGLGAYGEAAPGRRAIGALQYRWQRTPQGGAAWEDLGTTTAPTFTDTSATPGQAYVYRVRVEATGATAAVTNEAEGLRPATETRLGVFCEEDDDCGLGAWCPTAIDPAARRCAPRVVVDGVAFPFQFIPATAGWIGSPSSEPGRFSNEVHREVELTRDYYMQSTEMTQAQWTALTGEAISFNSGCPTCPVETVTFWSVLWLANELSRRDGLTPCYVLSDELCTGNWRRGSLNCGDEPRPAVRGGTVGNVLGCTGYRLPTEAEWEIAARAGTTSATYAGTATTSINGCPSNLPWLVEIMRICEPSTAPVAGRLANTWGLHDMLGNVSELTWDPWNASPAAERSVDPILSGSATRTAYRGGHFTLQSVGTHRAAYRTDVGLNGGFMQIGFRLVRTRHPVQLGERCAATEMCAKGLHCPEDVPDNHRRCAPFVQGGSSETPFVFIPGGAFTMGARPGELGGSISTERQREIVLTRDYFMSAAPITQRAWTDFAGSNPAAFVSCGATCPVENLTWWSALWFANVLSSQEGLAPCYVIPNAGCTGSGAAGTLNCGETMPALTEDHPAACEGYRLPTEAEWERAVRAGTATHTWAGDLTTLSDGCDAAQHPVLAPIAWFCGNAEGETHPVGGRAPHPWGLLDALGNVQSFVFDAHRSSPDAADLEDPVVLSGSLRAARGCSFGSAARVCRAADRTVIEHGTRVNSRGFRLVRSHL